VLAAWSACSAPPAAFRGSPTSGSTALPSATVAGDPAPTIKDMGRVCIATKMPDEWRSGLGPAQTPNGVRIGLAAVAPDGTEFGQYSTVQENGIAGVGRDGSLTKIARYDANVSGLNTLGIDPPFVVWSQGDSTTNIADWSVRSWNQNTGAATTIATSHLPDGTLLFGQQPIPVVRQSLAAWAQPLPRRGSVNESEVRVIDLGSGRITVLATGRVSNPVFAGSLLIWARRDESGDRYSFEAADPLSLQSAQLPAALKNPGSIVYLAGSSRYLAWSAEGLLTASVWTVGTSEIRSYSAPDIKHYFQFLHLAGHYLLWYGGITSSLLDLDSASGFDQSGSLAGSDDWIAFEEPTGAAAKGQFISSRLYRLSVNAAPTLRGCTP